MDISLHHLAKRVIHHSVTLQFAAAFKGISNNIDRKVSFAISSTSMSLMLLTIVADMKFLRRKG